MDELPALGRFHDQPVSLGAAAGKLPAEWQRTLDALRESDNRFRTLAECAPVVVWMTDVNCACTYISQYWRQFTGRDPDMDLGYGWVKALHPDDRDRAARDLREAARLVQPCRGEYRVKRGNGEYGWLCDFGVPHFHTNGSYAGHIGTCTDITEHKKRELAGHKIQDNLLLGQEAERKRLSRELHDDIGQRIAVLAMALTEIELVLPSTSPVIEEKLHAVRRDVDLLALGVRRLSHNLHPSTVVQLGPMVALRQLCREFSEQTHISVDFAGGNISRMSEDVAVALFRISQECLTNIAKHSKSREASVALSEESGELRLTITDRGVGFDTTRLHADPGLGLISIRERARMIGGLLDIRSAASAGTTVELRVPTSVIAAANS